MNKILCELPRYIWHVVNPNRCWQLFPGLKKGKPPRSDQIIPIVQIPVCPREKHRQHSSKFQTPEEVKDEQLAVQRHLTADLMDEKIKINADWCAWVAQWVKPLPSAQIMISGSWDWAPYRALCSAGSLLPPLSLPACNLCLSDK